MEIIALLLLGSNPPSDAGENNFKTTQISESINIEQEEAACNDPQGGSNEIVVCGKKTDQEKYRYDKKIESPDNRGGERIVIDLMDNVALAPELEQRIFGSGYTSQALMFRVTLKF